MLESTMVPESRPSGLLDVGGSADTEPADVRELTLGLLDYCRCKNWAGYDPYDALNSKVLRALPFVDCKLVRLVLTQANKRSPINFRPLLGVAPRQNAKGLALFVSALLKLSHAGLVEELATAKELSDRLLELRSPDQPYDCWGYSFPWQTRSRLVPEGSPNLVCTTFVANALLDAHDEFGEARYLEAARSAADYIVNELYYESDDGSVAGFAYPLPTMRNEIHNANLLAAALLSRVAARCGGDRKYLDPALAAARFSTGKQREDGSWLYGETPNYGWVDHFHTGFNLCALRDLGQHLATDEFESALRRGFDYYLGNLFRADAAPKYFHDKVHPIDAHCVAQGLITLVELRDLHPGAEKLSRGLFNWAAANMWDRRGYFHYRVYPLGKNRIPYMRWTQGWMLLALATTLQESGMSGPANVPS